MPTIEIWSDTRGLARCRDDACGARITWAEVVATGRRMPFTGEPVALQTRHDPETHRLIEVVDLEENHWKDCPARNKFRRRHA